MIELNSAHIIRETRQTKYYLGISSAEIRFVASYKALSDGEKLIWIIIADHCALDPHYCCILTQSQIAELVNKTTNTVGLAISKLRALGFLRTESISYGPLSYFLTLPSAGLEALLAAPTRKQGTPPLKTMDPSPENPGTPPRKTMDLLINNNINNKKHNHNLNAANNPLNMPLPSTITETDSPLEQPIQTPMQNADALLCEYKNLQEKFKNLPIRQQIQNLNAHFSAEDRIKIYKHQRALNAVKATEVVALSSTPEFKAKLEQAAPVSQNRVSGSNIKLIEFELEGELFLVEEEVRNRVLNQIPDLYQQNKIIGDARQKPINTLLKEILFYVTKASSKALDACQLQRFHTARKLCLKGAWERPNGLVRQASIISEQKWQLAKMAENKFAKEFTQKWIQGVA